MEIERQVEARKLDAVIGHEPLDRQIGLADQKPLIGVGSRHFPHERDRPMHLGLIHGIGAQEPLGRWHVLVPIGIWGIVAQACILEQMMDRIHPKAVDAPLEPEAQHIEHGRDDFGIAPVQIRLPGEVGAVIELSRPLVEGPGRAAELAYPIIGRPTVGASVAPDIPIAFGALPRGTALDEPGVQVGSVVRHIIEDDLEALAMRLVEEAIEILHRAEHRIDAAMIANVVAEIRHGRGIDRRYPDRIDPERDEMIEPSAHAFEIADAVPIRVLEGPRIDLIDDGAAPPGAFARITARHRQNPPSCRSHSGKIHPSWYGPDKGFPFVGKGLTPNIVELWIDLPTDG